MTIEQNLAWLTEQGWKIYLFSNDFVPGKWSLIAKQKVSDAGAQQEIRYDLDGPLDEIVPKLRSQIEIRE